MFQRYYVHFVQTGDPNGPGLPTWPAARRGEPVQVLQLDLPARTQPEAHRARYLLLDQML